MIKIRIKNADHEIDIRFPISESELFAKLGEIHAVEGRDAAQSALVTEVYWPEEFSMLKDRFANLDELKAHYQRGGLGDVKVKKFLNSILQAELAPIRERRAQWQKDIPGVYEILKKGSEVARAEAAQTLADVKRAMRINYFEDGALIQSQVEKYR